MSITDSHGSEPVDWTPLTNPDGWRVICLQPGQGSEELNGYHIELAPDALTDDYTAISYACGNTDLTHTIVCNDHLAHITASLHSALRRVRHPLKAILVWADALCIQQGQDSASLLERSHQITLMSGIFSSATRVIVSLGDDDGSLAAAFDGMNAILATDENLRLELQYQPDPIAYLGLPEFSHPMWSALRKLLLREWFVRTWVVQEVVLAQEVSVMFGQHQMNFDNFCAALETYQWAARHALSISEPVLRIDDALLADIVEYNRPTRAMYCLASMWQRREIRLSPDEPESPSLCDLMMSTMSQECTDPRDKIYALYGLVSGNIVKDLPVSYTEPVDAFSLRTSLYLLDNGNGAFMLTHGGGIRSDGIQSDRPSWTLDLMTVGAKERLDPMTSTMQASGQNVSYRGAGGSGSLSFSSDSSGRSLTVTGVVVGEFASMPDEFVVKLPVEALTGHQGGAAAPPGYNLKNLSTLLAAASWAEAGAMAGLHSDDAFWRTIVADQNAVTNDEHRDPDTGRTRPGFGQYFRELISLIDSIVTSDPALRLNELSNENRSELLIPVEASKYWGSLTGPYMGRRAARLQSGTLALVPQTSELTDVLAVFQGVPLPFVLRPNGEGTYQVVGICYIHGMMDGEAMQCSSQLRDIVLV